MDQSKDAFVRQPGVAEAPDGMRDTDSSPGDGGGMGCIYPGGSRGEGGCPFP